MEEKFAVHLSSQASRDLKNIKNHILETFYNRPAAENAIKIIEKRIMPLSYNADGFRILDEEPFHSANVRRIHVKQYNVYYRINNGSVEVLTISHSLRSLKNILKI